MTVPPERSGARLARGTTLLITNLTKLAGLVSALNEMLIRSSLRPSAVAVSAFMMAGAQLSEGVVLAAIDRVMGSEPKDKPVEPKT